MSMTLEDAAVVRQPKPVPNTPENVLEQFSMKGKVVAITGASDGIGWAVAEAIAEAGGDLALWYNTNDAAISKSERIAKKHGIRAKAYQVEVSDHEAVRLGVDEVVKDFGRLDVFVANAGMAISKAITEQTIEEYRKQMSVNVDGVVFCAKYAGAVFKSQGFGNLIITSSISAHIANVPVDQPVWLSFPPIVLHVLTSSGLQHIIL
ncbi:putative NADP-dependent mannitol dehydrogenase [Aureobasidium pullulans]|nr:putative NADP-dependent mannitol dehydrogenase [Aureobasidium pullulans]